MYIAKYLGIQLNTLELKWARPYTVNFQPRRRCLQQRRHHATPRQRLRRVVGGRVSGLPGKRFPKNFDGNCGTQCGRAGDHVWTKIRPRRGRPSARRPVPLLLCHAIVQIWLAWIPVPQRGWDWALPDHGRKARTLKTPPVICHAPLIIKAVMFKDWLGYQGIISHG
jgi:hypothetical protein